jgi:DNA-directed RNA polymerase subunit RPC12/RpoP
LNTKKFTQNDTGFVCSVCGKSVPPLYYTSRDHCPNCLSSIHIDINPGDRLCECKGILEPIGIEKKGDSIKIVYRCKKCHVLKKNKVATDDNSDLIIELSKFPY